MLYAVSHYQIARYKMTIDKEKKLMQIKIEDTDFRDLYRLDFSGLHANYDKLGAFNRDDLIDIRNTLQRLRDVLFIIKETDLGKILSINIRADLLSLSINENLMSEFINILNKIIIDKTIEQRKSK